MEEGTMATGRFRWITTWQCMIQNFRKRNLMDHKLEGTRGRCWNQAMKPKFYKLGTLDPIMNIAVCNFYGVYEERSEVKLIGLETEQILPDIAKASLSWTGRHLYFCVLTLLNYKWGQSFFQSSMPHAFIKRFHTEYSGFHTECTRTVKWKLLGLQNLESKWHV